MNIYYLKKYRKDAKKRIKIRFIDNKYNVMKYDAYDMEWKLISEWRPNSVYITPNLYVAKQTLVCERRKYILNLVKNMREFNKNNELAKL